MQSTALRPSGRVSRSWQLVPARNPDSWDALTQGPADRVILDIEDGILPDERPSARRDVRDWLGDRGSAWVRISPGGTNDFFADLECLQGLPGLEGVMLAKTESADAVAEVHNVLDVEVIPLIESGLGVERAEPIAGAAGVLRLAFGIGDFRRDTGAGAGDLPLLYARSRLVSASAAHGLPGAIDGPLPPGDAGERDSGIAHVVDLGMTGKLVLKSEHLDVVNNGFSPSAEQLTWAHELLNTEDAAERDGSYAPDQPSRCPDGQSERAESRRALRHSRGRRRTVEALDIRSVSVPRRGSLRHAQAWQPIYEMVAGRTRALRS